MDENIGKKLLSYLVLFIAIIVMAFGLTMLLENLRQRKHDEVWRAEAAESQTYTEGFCAGMRATLNNVKLANTNVELAPILDEMNRQYTLYHSNSLARVKP
jgi:uncharacterized membrane protein